MSNIVVDEERFVTELEILLRSVTSRRLTFAVDSRRTTGPQDDIYITVTFHGIKGTFCVQSTIPCHVFAGLALPKNYDVHAYLVSQEGLWQKIIPDMNTKLNSLGINCHDFDADDCRKLLPITAQTLESLATTEVSFTLYHNGFQLILETKEIRLFQLFTTAQLADFWGKISRQQTWRDRPSLL